MQHIELTVKGLSYSQGKSGAYALILAEVGEGGRKLPVVIGGPEAQSITYNAVVCSLEKRGISVCIYYDNSLGCTDPSKVLDSARNSYRNIQTLKPRFSRLQITAL